MQDRRVSRAKGSAGGNPKDATMRLQFLIITTLAPSLGAITGVDDPADPGFRRMIAHMTRELFPHRRFRDGFDESASGRVN